VVLAVARSNKDRDISIELIVEMFWTGAVLGIVVAVGLEAFGQYKAPLEGAPHLPVAVRCLRVCLIIVISVGFSEELAKLLPVALLKTNEEVVPFTCVRFFRLVESPYGIALAGCASAAGFATIENINYVFHLTSFEASVQVALARALTSVPLHVACTCFASARIAKFSFPPEMTPNPLLTPSVSSRPSVWQYLRILSVPAVLHGLFDTSLILTAVFSKHVDKNDMWSSHSQLVGVAYTCLIGLPILLYIAALTLAIREWKSLASLPNPSQMFFPDWNDQVYGVPVIPLNTNTNVVVPLPPTTFVEPSAVNHSTRTVPMVVCHNPPPPA